MNTHRVALSELFNDPFFATLGVHPGVRRCAGGRDSHRAQHRQTSEQVPVSVTRNGESITVTCDLPGVKMEDLNLTLDGDELQISAKRELTRGANKEQSETTHRSYSAKLKLGKDIDIEKISAQLDAGVLTVELPLVVEKQPRRIEIKAA